MMSKSVDDIQKAASDPNCNIYVNASAGSGKTKVLIDRLIRILMTRKMYGSIFCITYTNAAASEMRQRLRAKLLSWKEISDLELCNNLSELGIEFRNDNRDRSDALYENDQAQILHKARGLHGIFENHVRIQTVHSFASSILSKFGMLPEPDVPYLLNDNASITLLEEALHTMLRESHNGIPEQLLRFDLSRLCRMIMQIRERIMRIDIQNLGHNVDRKYLYKLLNLHSVGECTPEFEDFVKHYDVKVREIISMLLQSPNLLHLQRDDFSKCSIISEIVDRASDDEGFDKLSDLFITKSGSYRKQYYSKHDSDDVVRYVVALRAEFLDVKNLMEKALQFSEQEALVNFACDVIQEYEKMKREQEVCDYDDIIMNAMKLMSEADWGINVLYYVDSLIDYMLIDEAQDLSYVQWRFLQMITDEFYSGEGAKDNNRTIFIVGDYKQSIFGFQGARPEIFLEARARYARKCADAGKEWREVDMNVNFRSAQKILDYVDAKFSGWNCQHVAYDQSQDGMIMELDNAQTLVDMIGEWLQNRRKIVGTDKIIAPFDIMLLVRKRGRVSDHLFEMFINAGIPISSLKSKKMPIELVDLLSVARFIAQPYDDLNTVSLLKSPLINISESELFELCYERKDSVWRCITKVESDAGEKLRKILDASRYYCDVVAFYEWFLYEWRDRLSKEYDEAVAILYGGLNDYMSEKRRDIDGFSAWFEERDSKIDDVLKDEVRMMTVHSAKGLESPITIFCDIEERGPYETIIEHGDWFVLNSSRQFDALQQVKAEYQRKVQSEEDRISYVAMTRAVRELYILRSL